jgi:hypothetical protein
MLHRCAALTVVLAATGALAVPAVAADGPAVKGDGFTTTLPSGWTSHVRTTGGQRQWLWGSHGTRVSTLGIPTKGGIGVNAFVQTNAALKRQFRGSVPADPVAVLVRIVGVPKGATHLKAITKARATTLAGAKAGTTTLSYTYKKRSIVQTDVLALVGGKAYFVELDVDKANAAKGQAALKAITAAWKFS